MSKEKQFAIFGLGRFGSHVAMTLEDLGCDVLSVDRDENIVEDMSEVLSHVVSFDICEERALREAGISNFDVVVIASKNLEASLMATMLCKEMGVPEVIVKAINERHAEMATKLGATKIIFSEKNSARRLARSLVSPNGVDYIDIDADIKMIKLPVPPKFVGKNLIDTNVRAEYNVNIVAITNDNETIVTPPPDRLFVTGDKIFVFGTNDSLTKFEQDVFD